MQLILHLSVRNSRGNDRQKSSWTTIKDHSGSLALAIAACRYVVPLYQIIELLLMETEKSDFSEKYLNFKYWHWFLRVYVEQTPTESKISALQLQSIKIYF